MVTFIGPVVSGARDLTSNVPQVATIQRSGVRKTDL
jgi:hypothetical protein